MYNEIFANYNVKAFNDYVSEIKKQQGLKSSVEDLVELILECLKQEATKRKKGNSAVLGIDDKTLMKAVIKADSIMPRYKKEKEKKTPEVKVEPQKAESKSKKTEPKKKEKKGEKFNISQIELFDFE